MSFVQIWAAAIALIGIPRFGALGNASYAKVPEIMENSAGVKLFYCHAEEDTTHLLELDRHLALLRASGIIETLAPGRIEPGRNRNAEIARQLEAAEIILLLLSVDLVASSLVYEGQIQQAMTRQQAGTARVIPLLLREADYTGAAFAKLVALPRDGKPISNRPRAERDTAWAEIARHIRAMATEIAEAAAGLQKKSTLDDAASERLGQRLASRRETQERRTRWQKLAGTAIVVVVSIFAYAWMHPLGASPLAPLSGGLIIAAGWPPVATGKAMKERLCADLSQLNPGKVSCITVPMPLFKGRVLQAATAAGAVALVLVESDTRIDVALTGTGSRGLFPSEALPPIHIHSEDSRHGLVKFLDALLHAIAGRPIRSLGVLSAQKPDHLAPLSPDITLLEVMLQWQEESGRPLAGDGSSKERTHLLGKLKTHFCEDRGLSLQDLRCALASYFDALDCQAEQVSACAPFLGTLRQLIYQAPDARLRLMAGIEVARRTCSVVPQESIALLDRLDQNYLVGHPCERLLLAPLATCLRLAAPATLQAQVVQRPWAQLDATQPGAECPAKLRANVLAEQGFWFTKGRDFISAGAAFAAAYHLSQDPLHALSLAEMLLLQRRTMEVRQSIVLGRLPPEPSLHTHALFLLWLASRTKENAQQLLSAYASLPLEERAVFDAADSLNSLACASVKSQTCEAYRILIRPKNINAKEELSVTLIRK